MRVLCCLFFLLPACASHTVRCDGHLEPINRALAGGAVVGAPPRGTP